MRQENNPDWFDTANAAQFLKSNGCPIEKSTLDAWRSNKAQHIPYFRVGRLVYYKRQDLMDWLESCRVDPSVIARNARQRRVRSNA